MDFNSVDGAWAVSIRMSEMVLVLPQEANAKAIVAINTEVRKSLRALAIFFMFLFFYQFAECDTFGCLYVDKIEARGQVLSAKRVMCGGELQTSLHVVELDGAVCRKSVDGDMVAGGVGVDYDGRKVIGALNADKFGIEMGEGFVVLAGGRDETISGVDIVRDGEGGDTICVSKDGSDEVVAGGVDKCDISVG